ncbi:MAG: hypothetical protein EBX52_06680 [Proteobacteria bacterium]|nr:hypothetical protein [Pseudomonadota bacterium]
MTKSDWLKSRTAAALAVLAVTASACGPQAFVPSAMRSRQSAAGTTTIPAKVDVVFGMSQNTSMLNIAPGLSSEIPQFLHTLFPITGKVSVSRYDTNTPAANWLPPYPGASYTNPLLGILSSLVAPSFTYPVPNYYGAPTNLGIEYGLKNQLDFVSRADVGSQFLRSDAVMALVTLSNGEDRSWATAPATGTANPWTYPSNSFYTGTGGVYSQIKSIKVSPSLVKYYSLVAHNNRNCRGLGSWSGIRYEQHAQALNGKSVDICSVSIKDALTTVASDIQGTPLPFERNFLVIATEPNPATIQVTKYPNGDTNSPITIPEDATNGWTYAGYLTNQDTIDAPIAMDQKTGYMVELHGTAKLNGSDMADVTYQNTGTVSSH